MTSDRPQTVERFLTLAQVADALQVSRRSVERLIAKGQLPSVRIDGVGRRVKATDLRTFTERASR